MRRVLLLALLVPALLTGCTARDPPANQVDVDDLHANCRGGTTVRENASLAFPAAQTPWEEVPRVVNESGIVRVRGPSQADPERAVLLAWEPHPSNLVGIVEREQAPGLVIHVSWATFTQGGFVTSTPTASSPLAGYVDGLRAAFEPVWGNATGGEVETRASQVVC